MPHFLVILEKGEDWEIKHPDDCPMIKAWDGLDGEPIMVHDCLVGKIAEQTGIDDEFTEWQGRWSWRDLPEGKYEITAWEHTYSNFYGSGGEYEAGLEFVDVHVWGKAT